LKSLSVTFSLLLLRKNGQITLMPLVLQPGGSYNPAGFRQNRRIFDKKDEQNVY
jgi:hypothetical protein